MRLGTLDLGSSSLHLWIVELTDRGPVTVHLERASLRLVQRWEGGRARLDPQVAAQARAAVATMVARCREHGCDHVQIAATAAVREAEDHGAFCDGIHHDTGVSVRVLSGEDEAAISFLGVLPLLDLAEGPALVFDLGGGSTELALGDRGGARWLRSLPLGHLRCTSSPTPATQAPGPAATARVRRLAEQVLQEPLAALAAEPWGQLVGVSGTVWTLSRMVEADQGRPAPTGRAATRLELAELTALRARIEATPAAGLATWPGMDARRSDSLHAGAVIVETLLRTLGRHTLFTAVGGVREGLVADFARGLQGRPQE